MEERDGEIQLITFKLGENVYAVDVRHVREVVSLRKIVKLPRAPPYIEGIMNLRGRIVTLVNLSSYLGINGYEMADSSAETPKGKVLIFTLDSNRDLGFMVDHVLGVLRVKSNAIEKPASATDPSLSGVIKTDDGGIIIVLNIPHLVKELNLTN